MKVRQLFISVCLVAFVLVALFNTSARETVLFEKESAVDNQMVRVYTCESNMRCLRFGTTSWRQSVGSFSDRDLVALRYVQASLSVLALHPDALSSDTNTPLKVLIIGLGGGSMARFLNEHYAAADLTIVEYDQTVVDAQPYMSAHPIGPQVTIHVESDTAFAARTDAQFDVVFVDGGSLMALEKDDDARFFSSIVAPHGVISFNGFASDDFQARAFSHLQRYFGRVVNVNCGPDAPNSVLLASMHDCNDYCASKTSLYERVRAWRLRIGSRTEFEKRFEERDRLLSLQGCHD